MRLIKTYFIEGKTVGIRIQDVNPTSTDHRFLPCKVPQDYAGTKYLTYKHYTSHGLLKHTLCVRYKPVYILNNTEVQTPHDLPYYKY